MTGFHRRDLDQDQHGATARLGRERQAAARLRAAGPLAHAAGVFGQEKTEPKEASVDLKALHAKIGELTLENYFLSGPLGKPAC